MLLVICERFIRRPQNTQPAHCHSTHQNTPKALVLSCWLAETRGCSFQKWTCVCSIREFYSTKTSEVSRESLRVPTHHSYTGRPLPFTTFRRVISSLRLRTHMCLHSQFRSSAQWTPLHSEIFRSRTRQTCCSADSTEHSAV
jgi:hypothetical protein